jgi:hypothetical protein
LEEEMAGKPKTLTEEQKSQVEALASCLSKEQIADYFGIAKGTFYAMCDREPDILERYKRGKARVIKDIANSLITMARDGDKAAAMFYLKTQAGWRETNHVDHTSSDGTMTPQKVERVIVKAKDSDG